MLAMKISRIKKIKHSNLKQGTSDEMVLSEKGGDGKTL